MRRFFILPVLIGIIFIAAVQNHALQPKNENKEKLILKIRQALLRIRPFKVSFVQEVYTDEHMDLQESGNIFFINDKKLKWVYRNPEYKVFLLEEDNYRFYDEDSEQLRIGKVKEKQKQWIWQMLFSDDIIPHTTTDPAGTSIHIKKSSDNIDIKVTVDRRYLPIEIIQTDPSEIRMVYRFNDYKYKITVTEDLFKLKVPEDVEIIRD